ncbi:hypothetical protein B0H17DRAFT_917673 [Mycena rosella]|uniref:Mitochondrial carrier n=1 Tax=Mycena rosella TaxID=1033263 RepID=A0AAD7GY21_MYCRO|nr:hypothetical protein B0H17DRAFT_917673 [Mycena rosella]
MLFTLLCALSVPFNGILVRYRVSSHPKLSVEDGSVPLAPTFIGVAKRVWRLQGMEGLTRGLIPTIMGAFLTTLLFPFSRPKLYFSPSPMYTQGIPSSLFAVLLHTVLVVTVYRAIVTPRKLDPLNAREALHILFSAHERKKPWAIYKIPGLLTAVLAIQALRGIHPLYSHAGNPEYGVRQGILVLVALLGTIVIAPLEVIVTRLALQRNYGGLSFDDVLDVESALPLTAARSTPPVAAPVRSENAPYLGLIDCGKKIIAEEGWPVLYRMWFLTFLGIFLRL